MFQLKILFWIVHIPSAAISSPISNKKLMHGPCTMCRLLQICDRLQNSLHNALLPTSGRFYLKTMKCYNLDAYQAKKCKQEKSRFDSVQARLQETFGPWNTMYSLLMICPTDPSLKKIKFFFLIPSKGHSRARTLVEFKEIFLISFSQYANNVRTPLFRSMRHAQNTDTHALNIGGCPKIVRHCDPISLLINTFGIHLEPGC